MLDQNSLRNTKHWLGDPTPAAVLRYHNSGSAVMKLLLPLVMMVGVRGWDKDNSGCKVTCRRYLTVLYNTLRRPLLVESV